MELELEVEDSDDVNEIFSTLNTRRVKIVPASYVNYAGKKEEKQEEVNKMIKSVTINEDKKIITVVFKDGDVQMSKCDDKDTFDVGIGISLACTAHLFGSKNKFKKFVEVQKKKSKK